MYEGERASGEYLASSLLKEDSKVVRERRVRFVSVIR